MKKFLLWGGVAVLAFGVVTLGASFVLPIKTSAEWYTKVGGINVGAILTILASQYEKLKALLPAGTKEKVVQVISDVVDKAQDNKPSIELAPSTARDYECIHYLAKRCATMSPEAKASGMQACSTLNDLFFKDYNNETNIPNSTPVA